MRKTSILLVLACLIGKTFAQNPPTIVNVAIPPSPEASALAQYTDIPVGHYTGVPQISLPLAQLSGRNLSVPVSLSYHASGIRVDQVGEAGGVVWNPSAFTGKQNVDNAVGKGGEQNWYIMWDQEPRTLFFINESGTYSISPGQSPSIQKVIEEEN